MGLKKYNNLQKPKHNKDQILQAPSFKDEIFVGVLTIHVPNPVITKQKQILMQIHGFRVYDIMGIIKSG